MFNDAKLHVSDVAERVALRLEDADHIVAAVTKEVGETASRASSWAGAARIARGLARSYVKRGKYLHALVADTIADHYTTEHEAND